MTNTNGYKGIMWGYSMYNIIIFDSSTYILNRVKKLLNEKEFTIHVAKNTSQLKTMLAYRDLSADMILADIEYKDEAESVMLKEYLDSHPQIPLTVFTAEGTKEAILHGAKMGATDFILKSISGDELQRRIVKIIGGECKKILPTDMVKSMLYDEKKRVKDTHAVMKPRQTVYTKPIKENRQVENRMKSIEDIPSKVVIDLKKFLSGEIKKAEKGQYKLTITFSTIDGKKDDVDGNLKVSKVISGIFESYWDTDFLVPYGNHMFVSFFPFCDENTLSIIEEKLQDIFIKRSNLEALSNYKLNNSYITYPVNGMNKDNILKIIEKKMEWEIVDKK